MHLGDRVASVTRRGDEVTSVTLTSGQHIASDAVIVGIGSVPATEWLRDSGLDVSDGIRCDARLRAADHVWAAGDVASVLDPVTRTHQRHEHRFSANDHASVIAADLMGHPSPTARPAFMWTDQYATKIQVVGQPRAGVDPEIVETGADDESFVGRWTHEGEVVALVGWNAPRLLNRHRRELNDAHAARHLTTERLNHAH